MFIIVVAMAPEFRQEIAEDAVAIKKDNPSFANIDAVNAAIKMFFRKMNEQYANAFDFYLGWRRQLWGNRSGQLDYTEYREIQNLLTQRMETGAILRSPLPQIPTFLLHPEIGDLREMVLKELETHFEQDFETRKPSGFSLAPYWPERHERPGTTDRLIEKAYHSLPLDRGLMAGDSPMTPIIKTLAKYLYDSKLGGVPKAFKNLRWLPVIHFYLKDNGFFMSDGQAAQALESGRVPLPYYDWIQSNRANFPNFFEWLKNALDERGNEYRPLPRVARRTIIAL